MKVFTYPLPLLIFFTLIFSFSYFFCTPAPLVHPTLFVSFEPPAPAC